MFNSKKIIISLVIAGLLVTFSMYWLKSVQSQYIQFSESNLDFSCKTNEIYIPVLQNDFFSSQWEIENNDDYTIANGPLLSGKQYFGFPDSKDYFRFDIRATGIISIVVENYTGINPQLQLRYKNPTHVRNTVIPYTHSCPSNVCELSYTPPVDDLGRYLIYITADNSTNIPYTLTVHYPLPSPVSSTSIPYCTATPTPSNTPATPSVTPSQTPETACEFEAIGTGFSVLFPRGDGGQILANKEESDAITTAVSLTPISRGYYSVTMYSYDDHTTKPEQTQTAESWYLRLKNAEGTVVATAGPSIDIPDGAGNDCMGTYVKDSLVLLDTAVFAEAYHAAYLDPNPQSVNPDYALLIPYRMIEPIPSQTPTPTYRRTTTPTPPP